MSNTIDDMVGRIDEKLAHTVSDIQFIKESQSVMQSRLGNLENKVDVFIFVLCLFDFLSFIFLFIRLFTEIC